MTGQTNSSPGEMYCAECERTFATGERCPYDDSRLVRISNRVDPLIGRELDGRYAIVEKLGQGGMGAVYRGIQHSFARDVAIKVLNANAMSNPDMIKRFLREAKLASKLAHQNAVSVLDFGETEDNVFYLVMELVTGRTLDEVLNEDKKFSPERVVRIGTQICEALEGAHALQIVHRDLKPANVMVLSRGRDIVKVLDFGLAKSIMPEPNRTMTGVGMMLGTPAFMPPELATGQPCDGRADLYSLGCILFLLGTGVLPFQSESANELIAMHGVEKAPAMTDVPEKLAAIIDRLLAKSPDERFQSATETREALETCLDNSGPMPIIYDRVSAPVMAAPASAVVQAPVPPAGSAPVVSLAAQLPEGRRRTSPWVFVLFGLLVIAAGFAAPLSGLLGPSDMTRMLVAGGTSASGMAVILFGLFALIGRGRAKRRLTAAAVAVAQQPPQVVAAQPAVVPVTQTVQPPMRASAPAMQPPPQAASPVKPRVIAPSIHPAPLPPPPEPEPAPEPAPPPPAPPAAAVAPEARDLDIGHAMTASVDVPIDVEPSTPVRAPVLPPPGEDRPSSQRLQKNAQKFPVTMGTVPGVMPALRPPAAPTRPTPEPPKEAPPPSETAEVTAARAPALSETAEVTAARAPALEDTATGTAMSYSTATVKAISLDETPTIRPENNDLDEPAVPPLPLELEDTAVPAVIPQPPKPAPKPAVVAPKPQPQIRTKTPTAPAPAALVQQKPQKEISTEPMESTPTIVGLAAPTPAKPPAAAPTGPIAPKPQPQIRTKTPVPTAPPPATATPAATAALLPKPQPQIRTKTPAPVAAPIAPQPTAPTVPAKAKAKLPEIEMPGELTGIIEMALGPAAHSEESGPIVGERAATVIEPDEPPTIAKAPSVGDDMPDHGEPTGEIAMIVDKPRAVTVLPVELPLIPASALSEARESEEDEIRGEATAVSTLNELAGEPTAITPLAADVEMSAGDSGELPNDPTAITPYSGELEGLQAPAPPAAPPPPAKAKTRPEHEGRPRIGEYIRLDEVKRGSGRSVFRGFDERLQREVNIETLPAALDLIAASRLATSLASLEHVNLVRVHELVVHAGRPYLVTEPLDGKTLEQHLTDRGSLPWLEAVALIDVIASGVELAHERGIIHRAIRPAMIILEGKTAKLGGFALAPELRDPGYVAPDVRTGSNPQRRSDIYALGATLYGLLTGRPPADDKHVLPEVPEKLQALVHAMLAKAPADRPTAVQDVRAAFKSLLDF